MGMKAVFTFGCHFLDAVERKAQDALPHGKAALSIFPTSMPIWSV
jgi:hypothetical protein